VKSRFPPDVLAALLGPFIVVAIVLGLGSVIYHVEQLRGTIIGYALVGAGVVAVIAMVLLRKRRQ